MHRLIAEEAGHRAVAELMSFVDHQDYEAVGLETPGRPNGEPRSVAAPRPDVPFSYLMSTSTRGRNRWEK